MSCYRDISYPRKLSGFTAEYPETLTPQHCVSLCKQKGFVYAGLQRGFQCFCGNENLSNRDKRPESDCNSKCRGDLAAICGGAWRNTIYSTGNSNDNTIENTCLTSVTRVNGKAACFNEVVFEDNFDTLSTKNWSPIVQIPSEPDYQFVMYKSDPEYIYTANGKLGIKPTLLSESEVKNGDLHLENCTGKPDKHECGYKAKSYVILPPVQSARLTTCNSFSFQYGKLEISAKLPEGDWLVSENLLFSVDGGQPFSLVPNGEDTLGDIVGFSSDVTPVWSSASRIAPFDDDFYVSLGVSVGGITNFPDNIVNNGKTKPWKNLELKAMLNFWRDKVSWLPTWHDDTALLLVDYVKVTAL